MKRVYRLRYARDGRLRYLDLEVLARAKLEGRGLSPALDQVHPEPFLHVAPDVREVRLGRHLQRVRQLQRNHRDACFQASEIAERARVDADATQVQAAEAR